MNLRRRSVLAVLSFAAAGFSGCASRPMRERVIPIQVDALTDEQSIRLRCEDPDGVIAGRVFCVLKDMPRVPLLAP